MKPGLLLVLALGGTMGACSGAHEPAYTQSVSTAPESAAQKPVLDVPGLLNLSIKELNHRLGPQIPVPNGFTDPVLLPLARTERVDSTALFRYQGLALVVSYDYKTGQVNNLLLLGTDEQQLMRSANLQLSGEQYLVMPVFEQRAPTRMMGIRVVVTTGKQSIQQ